MYAPRQTLRLSSCPSQLVVRGQPKNLMSKQITVNYSASYTEYYNIKNEKYTFNNNNNKDTFNNNNNINNNEYRLDG